MTERPRLAALLLGPVPDSAMQPLRDEGIDLFTIPVPVPAELPLATGGRQLNRFIDEAQSDWIVVLRGGESVGNALAAEIREAIGSDRAWGYRFLVEELYCGVPLPARERSAGEIRLFHRRRARFVADPGAREMHVQGTVVRLRRPLTFIRYASAEEHAAVLAASGARRNRISHLVRFIREAARSGAIFRSASVLRFLWIETQYEGAIRP